MFHDVYRYLIFHDVGIIRYTIEHVKITTSLSYVKILHFRKNDL